SLLNALLGRERALVSPQPGTTRDYLEEPMTIGRHAFRLIDTAGLNPNPGEIEAMGIARTFEQVAEANLIIVVAEAGAPFPPLPPEIGRQLQPRRALLVVNKCDLAAPPPSPPPAMEPLPLIEASAITGEGMAALRAELVALADALQPERFAGEVIAINARHAHALALAATSLREAQTDLAHGAAKSVLVASACRAALDALGLIAGRIDHEQVLDKLFGEFCIGK
ncbi:MAG TPA: GTPase, partial [Candidatus Synoicihabitans sp.]|nr:GTPase [Candidatus Synoicihabitans sp.]